MRLSLRIIALALLGALVATVVGGPAARAARPAAQAAPFRVYLPAVIGSGAPARAPRPQVALALDAGPGRDASIGPEGGSLRATAADGAQITLTIPADTLDVSEPITITPALAAPGLPLSGGMLGAVRIEPADLSFIAPASLTITPAAPPAAPQIVGFTAGAEFALMPAVAAAGLQAGAPAVTTTIYTTGSYGAAAGSIADLAAIHAFDSPLNPAAVLAEAQVIGPPDSLGQRLASLGVLLNDYVEPAIKRATADPSTLEQALESFDTWSYMVDTWQVLGFMDAKRAAAYAQLKAAVLRAASVAGERCYSQKRPEEAFRMQRYLRYTIWFQLDPSVADAIKARLAKCLSFKLTFHSRISVRGAYIYELRAEMPLRSQGGGRAVGSGPLTWVDYRFVGNTAPCTFITRGTPSTFDAKSANYGLRLTPLGRTSPQVKVSLRYSVGKPLEDLTIRCPKGTTVAPTASAWSSYFTVMHEYEWDNATASINTSTQIANVGSFTGWVYHNSREALVEDSEIELIHTPQL